jgi:hypothetical protein
MRKYDAGGLDFQGESNTLLAEQFHLLYTIEPQYKKCFIYRFVTQSVFELYTVYFTITAFCIII